jgi:short-subunit dehydrogenase
MVQVNINSQVVMTRLLLPRLTSRSKRSLIVNVSSSQILRPNPMLNLYSATKSFNSTFSSFSQFENIDQCTVVPSSTKSQMNPGTYLFSITAEAHAKAVVDQLGWTSYTRGHWLHAIQPYIEAMPLIGPWMITENSRRRKEFRKQLVR